MTDDTVTPVDMEDGDTDLTDFENDFYSNKPVAPVADEVQDESEDANEPEADENDDDPVANEDEPEDEDEEQDEPEPQPKPKNKTQERIEKLVSEARQAQREVERLLRENEQLKASKEEKPVEDKSLRGRLSAEAPSPDAVDADGEPIYPLGEFDPTYIRDLTKFTIEEEQKAAKIVAEQEAQQKAQEAALQEVRTTWLDNLDKAEAELPDIREKITDLTDTFVDIEPAYGEYLATTIMASEFGPQIMYFLSQNIDEAQRIVASGPVAATRAIGRLEARFEKPKTEEKRNEKKVSKAPTPPASRTRGSGGQFVVAPDTDNLDAFEKDFFK